MTPKASSRRRLALGAAAVAAVLGLGFAVGRVTAPTVAPETSPAAGQAKGDIRIDRVAANIVWTPVEGFKAGIEISVAWAKIAIAGREIQAGLAGRQISTQLFLERSF